MTTASWQLDNLRDCLLMTPAVELKGMALLRGCRPDSGFFPTGIPRDALIEAITEITVYTERAQQMAVALMSLTPTPLYEQAVLEYGL